MKNAKLTYATIGTSFITDRFIEGAAQTGRYEARFIYSRHINKAKAMADKHIAAGNIENVEICDDLKVIEASDVDVVYIASPNALHSEQIERFARAQKHIFCEKPLVVTKDEFNRAYEIADANGVFLIEAYRHINSPGFDAVKEAISAIGPIRVATLNYNQYSSRYAQFKDGLSSGTIPNVFNPDYAGGALLDLGCYPISFAVALWGRPKDFCYMPMRLENGVDGAGAMILDFDGFLCTINFSKVAQGYIQNEILGEDGAVLIDAPSELTEVLRIDRRSGERTKYDFPLYKNTLQAELMVFADIVTNNDVRKYEQVRMVSEIVNDLVKIH